MVGVWAEVTPASPGCYRSLLGSQQFGFPQAEDLPLQKISLFMTSSFKFGNAPSSPINNLLSPLCSHLYSRCFFVVLFPQKSFRRGRTLVAFKLFHSLSISDQHDFQGSEGMSVVFWVVQACRVSVPTLLNSDLKGIMVHLRESVL